MSAATMGMTAAAVTRSRSGTTTIATSAMSGSVNSQPRLWTIVANCSETAATAMSSPRSGPGRRRREARTMLTSASIVNSAAVELM